MKLETDFMMQLVESDDPLGVVGGKLLGLWLDGAEKGKNVDKYYHKGEEEARDFEEFILKSYWEIYDLLAKACLHGKNVFKQYSSATFVVMDGMSLRESALIYNLLKGEGYQVKHNLNLSAVPSDTEFFREKIDIPISKFSRINNHNNIRIAGSEKYIWSQYPDAMLDKIKVGHTLISSLKELYEITKKVVLEILEKSRAEKIIITSDHGYMRTEAGFVFPVSNEAKRRLQQTFGSKRYMKIDGANLNDLERFGYIKEFNGNYLAKSRYMWAVPGKYTIYTHGGLSLMECFVPVLEVVK